MHVIIPAAGLATRIGGMPKFMLPVGDKETLLLRHLRMLCKVYTDNDPMPITIVTRAVNAPMVREYLTPSRCGYVFPDPLDVLQYESQTMSDTVCHALTHQHTDQELTLVLMPDTFITPGVQGFIYHAMKTMQPSSSPDAVLLLFKIREDQRGKLGQVDFDFADGRVRDVVDKDPACTLPFAWGMMLFNKKFASFIKPQDPHTGYAIMPAVRAGLTVNALVCGGCEYYDCGTLSEYTSVLAKHCN